jgi:hypothetical protein
MSLSLALAGIDGRGAPAALIGAGEIPAVRVALESFLHPAPARPLMPRRMSVCPVAIPTRTPDGMGITAVVRQPAPQPLP